MPRAHSRGRELIQNDQREIDSFVISGSSVLPARPRELQPKLTDRKTDVALREASLRKNFILRDVTVRVDNIAPHVRRYQSQKSQPTW